MMLSVVIALGIKIPVVIVHKEGGIYFITCIWYVRTLHSAKSQISLYLEYNLCTTSNIDIHVDPAGTERGIYRNPTVDMMSTDAFAPFSRQAISSDDIDYIISTYFIFLSICIPHCTFSHDES